MSNINAKNAWEYIRKTAKEYDDDIFGPDMNCERVEG